MGQVYDSIDDRLREFILAQPVFFVGSAPSDVDGHVNVSPKGLSGSLVVLGAHRVAYLDYGGSGAETTAHLRENGRIVLMFCAFTGPPKIVRLHGKGTVHRPEAPGFAALRAQFGPGHPGLRSIVEVEVSRVSSSCGYGVPAMNYESDRDLLPRYWERRSPGETVEYWRKKNSTSIDGLPAITVDATDPWSAGGGGTPAVSAATRPPGGGR